MSIRRKSTPKFEEYDSSSTFTNEQSGITIDKVREVTSRIMNGWQGQGLYESGDDHKRTWAEHKKNLETKLPATNKHIQHLQKGIEEGGWNQEKILEVSYAMKEYIAEAETKEKNNQVEINRLKEENKQTGERLKNVEKTCKADKETYMKTVAENRSGASKRIAMLEESLKQKDDENKELCAEREQLKSKLLYHEREKIHFTDETKTIEESFCVELRSAKNVIEQHELKNQLHEEEAVKNGMILTALRIKEENLNAMVETQQKELEKKEHTIKELASQVETLRESYSEATAIKEETGRKLKCMSEREAQLIADFESLAKEHELKENTCKEYQGKVQNLEQKNTSLLNVEESQKMNLEKYQEENSYLVLCLKQHEEEIRVCSAKLKESISREQALEDNMKAMKRISGQMDNNDQVRIEEVIQKMNSMTNGSWKQDLEDMRTKFEGSRGDCLRLQRENDHLCFQIQQVTAEYNEALQKFNRDRSSTEETSAKLKEDLQFSITEKEQSKHLLQSLNAELDECKRMNLDQKKRYRFVIEKCEKYQEKLRALEKYQKEQDEGKLELKQKCAELQELENARKVLAKNGLQLRKTLQKQTRRMQSLEDENQKLAGEIQLSAEANNDLVECQSVYINRLKQLQHENENLNAGLIEMEMFMGYTRREVQTLQYENSTMANDKKKLEEELAKIKLNNDKNVHELEQYQCELQTCQTKCEKLFTANQNLQDVIKNDQQKFETASKESQDNLTKQANMIINLEKEMTCKDKEADYFKNQCYELVASLEDIQKELLLTSQRAEEAERESSYMEAKNEELKIEIAKFSNTIHGYEQEISELRKFEEAYQNQIQVTPEKMTRNEEIGNTQSLNKLQSLNYDHEKLRNQLKLLESDNRANQNQIINLNDDLENLKKEKDSLVKDIELINNENAKMEHENKELNSQLKFTSECLEKIKAKNKELTVVVGSSKQKQEDLMKMKHQQSETVKNLEKKKCQLQLSKTELEKEKALLKAKLIEYRGVIDGNNFKHTWLLQHDQDQGNDIKKLKNDLSESQLQVIEFNEKLAKLQLKNQKVMEDLQNEKAKCLELGNENVNIQREIQIICNQKETKILVLQEQLCILSKTDEQKNAIIEKLKQEKEELIREQYERSCESKILNDKYETLTNELEKMHMLEKQYIQQKEKDEIRFKDVKKEFSILVGLLKRIKQERDSFRAILLTCEEEKQHLSKNQEQMRMTLEQLQRKLQECHHANKRTLTDNEMMKSRLGILNYTEQARDLEQKKMNSKLEEYEQKVNQLTAQLKEATRPSVPETTQDISANINLVEKLKSLLNSKPIKKRQTSKHMENMKRFLETFNTVRSNQIHTDRIQVSPNIGKRNSFKSGARSCVKKRTRHIGHEDNIETLFKQSQALQDSLIEEMKSFTREHYF